MADLKIHQGDWVVVCDGAKALFLENAGDAKFPNLKTVEVHTHDVPKSREIGTDAPGRNRPSVGSAGGAMEEADPHDQAEQAFLRDIAGRLDQAVNSGRSKAIVMVAPPRALGVLRNVYSGQLRAAIRAELDKDYVKLPVYEIEKHLAG